MLRVAFTNRRDLDRGNASVEAIMNDFRRFDLDLWAAAAAMASQTTTRRKRLNQLNAWRNAIAHQDFAFDPQRQALVAETRPTLSWVRQWRRSCYGLAQTFDRVVGDHVAATIGKPPW